MDFEKRCRFRRQHRGLILSVRCGLLLAAPLAMLLIQSAGSGSSVSAPGNIENAHRRLLALPVIVENKEENCTPAAILEFPFDGLTKEQRQSGLILIHCILSCYAFILLAVVCDDYFVPAIKKMVNKLQMPEDIAGATFMAAATSSPELFINSVGTFITEGDLGVGTIVGSAVFNILAVPACCGLLGGQVVDLDWWAISRDSLMYGFAVIGLIFTLEDEKIMWYEALALVCGYIFYILVMYFNGAMDKCMKLKCNQPKNYQAFTEITPLLSKDSEEKTDVVEIDNVNNNGTDHHNIEDDDDDMLSIWSWPDDTTSMLGKCYWLFTWPIGFVLWLTIPNCRKYKSLYLITFFMCIIWIGFTAYFVAWMITVIGNTINIPDSVMGLTFLAAGTSVPEAVSSVIVTNQGHGAMGISSSIGSNTFDILLCLGFPWFIKGFFLPTVPGENWVNINSSGLTYNAISLFSTLLGLYVAFACNKFRLDWKIGITCTLLYAGFLTMASLIELNFFFPVNLPTCEYQ